MNGNHEWRLVAPWYRWKRQFDADGRKPWQSRPVFQKFDQADFVKSFTTEPQLSLVFLDGEDTVFNTSLKDIDSLSSGALVPPPRFTRLYAPNVNGIMQLPSATKAREARLVPTGTRKLYLPTHKRSYLVVCELHCYATGFPTATADQVCQSGFVVRRRSINIPVANQKVARPAGEKILRDMNSIDAEIAYWEQTVPATGRKEKQRALAVKKAKDNGTYITKLNGLKSSRLAEEQKLIAWRQKYGVTSTLEGWVPVFITREGGQQPALKVPVENVGSWQPVEETPKQTQDEVFPRDEATFPLFALFPDPNNPQHSAKGKNIYFGVVPASSFDTDQFGVERFDSDATYEIRCFVRRHKLDCPRLDRTPDCHGEIVWSEATEVYKIASATDLIGTSNRPITIKMPDFSELAAQVAALPTRKLAPVRVVQPQAMNFKVDDDGKPVGGGIGGFQICFFSIPLITIIAMFVLKLFLPIVVFLFGLFFLLQLKFCIPPSLAVSGGLSVKLDALMPKLEIDASIDVDVEFDASLGLSFTAPELNADFQTGLIEEHGIKSDPDGQLARFSNEGLLPLGEGIQDAKLLTADDGTPKAEAGLDLTGSIEFEPVVEISSK